MPVPWSGVEDMDEQRRFLTLLGVLALTSMLVTWTAVWITYTVHLDEERACQDILDAVARLTSRALNLSALILECTNMSPYREVIEHESGLPVFDINGLIFKQLET